MSVAGVSGSESDQDVINLLRDIAMLILNSSTRIINFEVGHALFHCLLLAMRRGYIETERFPEITANVISFYSIRPSTIPAGMVLDPKIHDSTSWIREIFMDAEDRHRDVRALKEVIAVVLGMKESETTINCKFDHQVSECVMDVDVAGEREA